MFPFAIQPDPDDDAPEASRTDDRGPDTASRILLHGARHHDREAVFLRWEQGREGWGWKATPDWRADRAAIRAALVLHGRLGVGEGDRIALWMPLGPEWAEVERAVWSLGAVSVAVWPEWPLERVADVLAASRPEVLFAPSLAAVEELTALGGRPDGLRAVVPLVAPEEQGDDWLSLPRFFEYGGVQDTPERASMWRTYARRVPADAAASLDHGDAGSGVRATGGAARPREVTQGQLVAWSARLTEGFPPRRGGTRVLATERPSLVARVLVLAGWADGLTRTAFATAAVARERAGELEPDLVAAPGSEAESLISVLAGPDFVSTGGEAPDADAIPADVRLVDGLELIAGAGGSPGQAEEDFAGGGDRPEGLEKRAESA